MQLKTVCGVAKMYELEKTANAKGEVCQVPIYTQEVSM